MVGETATVASQMKICSLESIICDADKNFFIEVGVLDN